MPENMTIGWGNKSEIYALPTTGTDILPNDKKITLQKIVKHSYTGGFLQYTVEIEHNRFDSEWTAFLKEYFPSQISEEKEETYEDGSKESIASGAAKKFFFISYGKKNAENKVPVYVMVGIVSSEAGGFDTGANTPIKPKTTLKSVKSPQTYDYTGILDTTIVNPGANSYQLQEGAQGDIVWINAAS